MILTKEDIATIIALTSEKLASVPEYLGTDLASLLIKLQWILDNEFEDC